jgi:hypothetical protein
MAQEAAMELAQELSHEANPETAAELLASAAAEAESEAEAARFARAAMTIILSRRDRAALRRLSRELTLGAALITRLLRRDGRSRVPVRALPLSARTATGVLAKRAAAGRPISRKQVGRVMAASMQRVLSAPNLCGRAILRNIRTTKVQPALLKRLRRRPQVVAITRRPTSGSRSGYRADRPFAPRPVSRTAGRPIPPPTARWSGRRGFPPIRG